MKFQPSIFFVSCSLFFLLSCSVSKQISRQGEQILINDSALRNGHIGISIYEPSTGKYWYNYNADKYFIPASNTKLFTLYAGMKYLGDSITGLRYSIAQDTIYALPTGDPTFMHPSFTNQPVVDYLKLVSLPVVFDDDKWHAAKYGAGWAWDDYNDPYMAERNALPIFGNVAETKFDMLHAITENDLKNNFSYFEITAPKEISKSIHYSVDTSLQKVIVSRNFDDNTFNIVFPDKNFSFQKEIPFATNGIKTALQILHTTNPLVQLNTTKTDIRGLTFKSIKTQPADLLFKLMMHNSDNFFAEQILLMVSNERLGYMSDENIIDTLLNSDLSGVPQKPRWVDGSGLSRYNLFTPMDFIFVLEKMRAEFGMERLKKILPTGGEGSLKNYFINDSSFIFAKTGTLSNNSALSGFLITKKGRLLEFSVLLNNYPGTATPARRAAEHFLEAIRKKY